MPSRTSAALAGLALAVLAAGCADPAAGRVSLAGAPQPSVSPPPPSPMRSTGAPRHPYPMATSLAEPMATGAPLPATGPPRFFVSARTPLARFTGTSKTATITPVPPAVHDAATGAFLANIPLPPGLDGTSHRLAARPGQPHVRPRRPDRRAGGSPACASSSSASARTGARASRCPSRRPTRTT
ncbi:hypothetical protein [Nonomuraea rubra]|uniref:hypothetical protein n=1 Tax=Nonomuraea rubra TaxID=46180 RepID=UPI0031EE433D